MILRNRYVSYLEQCKAHEFHKLMLAYRDIKVNPSFELKMTKDVPVRGRATFSAQF